MPGSRKLLWLLVAGLAAAYLAIASVQYRQFKSLEEVMHRSDVYVLYATLSLQVEFQRLDSALYRYQMERGPASLDEVQNGQAALDHLAAAAFDLVLMDVQMPVMDGLTATRHIRAQPRWAALPVLAMTANAMRGDREHCMDAGMNSHIAKPIDPDELFHQLRQWIPQRASAAPSPAMTEAPAHHTLMRDDPLQGIDGLDLAAGLRRVLQRRRTYEELLRKFVAGQADAVARTRQALTTGQHADAERAMHTLEGTAATIGADRLAQLAGTAEMALSAAAAPGEADLKPVLLAVEQATAALVAALTDARCLVTNGMPSDEPADAHVDAVKTIGAIDWRAARTTIDRLEALLAEDDSEAIDLFQQSSALLRNTLGESFPVIDSALEGYMLTDALTALREAKERISALV